MTIARELGERLRAYRTQRGWSQEEMAERADLHTTYIGQLERGEKNATIESISKVAAALNISLSKLFENISLAPSEKDVPSRCYDLIQKQPLRDQKLLLDILDTVVAYKKQ